MGGACRPLTLTITVVHPAFFQFKELQEAFNHIMAHLNDIEEAKLYRMAFYEAVVIKVHHNINSPIKVSCI